MARKYSLAPELYTDATTPVDLQLMAQMREQDETPVASDPTLPRIVLVVGPTPFSMMRGWEFFLTSPYEGISYISTVLSNAGYPTTIVDVRFDPAPLRSALRQVIGHADLVGISTFEDNFPFVRDLIAEIKAAAPTIPVIVGGSLVTSVPGLFMGATKADVAVLGEGELTTLELVKSFADERFEERASDIHGIMFRTPQGELVRTQPRGQMLDLDSLPRMRLDLWPQSKSPGGLQRQVISSYSRGCKMDCAFCFRTTPLVRSKSMDRLDRELKWLKTRYQTDFVFFTDLTFAGNVSQTLAVCDVIKQNQLRWTCMGRCVDADDVRLSAMRDAGCDIILFGVESLEGQALKEVSKPTTKNISIRAMRRANSNGVRFGALLIIGLPGETKEGLETMAAWAEQEKHVCRVKYLSALPGTQVYRDCLANGVIQNEVSHLEWLSIEQGLQEDEFLNLNRLPEDFMRKIHQRIYQCYQPGPVVDFKHFPNHFSYFHPTDNDGGTRSALYAGAGWRSKFSSAGIYPISGSERYTMDLTGAPGMASLGAAVGECGAKRQARLRGVSSSANATSELTTDH
jgi:anaerobic magnesium-protoporphyrin IX monomethyl ester cyclase